MASAQMDGDLTYRSRQKVEIYPDAQIADDITFIPSEGPRHLMARLFRTSGVSGPGRRITLMVVGVVVLGVITFVPAFGALVLLVAPSLSLGALTLEL